MNSDDVLGKIIQSQDNVADPDLIRNDLTLAAAKFDRQKVSIFSFLKRLREARGLLNSLCLLMADVAVALAAIGKNVLYMVDILSMHGTKIAHLEKRIDELERKQ